MLAYLVVFAQFVLKPLHARVGHECEWF